ncbi:lipoyl synthase [Chloracidobacterium sp. D]|uniref:lipoyl synthase n=1 Tax=Chloracidobacterium sp. D TaxID=2821536 RepID=UPI001B8AFC0C|nr:lipoyl synthase [Chloracidobacterium sp. D]QUV82115.1 lipoyl synthase [Chloracidobacterium sp. D]
MADRTFTRRDLRPERKPAWLKIRLDARDRFQEVAHMVDDLSLNTVCQEARCPNIWECFSNRTATFMLMGDICTRHCGFCAVTKGAPRLLDPAEPRHVAEAVRKLGLRHAVITSVNRDDLPDGGAHHFAATIREVRRHNPGCRVEVLIPDFCGNWEALDVVMEARPDVLNHNTETVKALYRRVRPDAIYARSMELLRRAAAWRSADYPVLTKSGVMLGLGETRDELLETMRDLRENDCDILTLGQYLRPSLRHLPVEKFYHPDEFAELRQIGLAMGFRHVEAGPLVRSSYHAHEQVAEVNAPVLAAPPTLVPLTRRRSTASAPDLPGNTLPGALPRERTT